MLYIIGFLSLRIFWGLSRAVLLAWYRPPGAIYQFARFGISDLLDQTGITTLNCVNCVKQFDNLF